MSGDGSMSMGEPDLEAALRALGSALAVSTRPAAPTGPGAPAASLAPDLAARVRSRIEAEQPRRAGIAWWDLGRGPERGPRSPRGERRLDVAPRIRRSLLLAAAALLLAAAAVTAAIGYGLPGIRILFGPPSSPSPEVSATTSPGPSREPGALLGLGVAQTLDEARGRVDFPILLPADPAIGPPDAVYLAGSRLTLVWGSSPALPGTAVPGIGLVLVELRGTVDEDRIEKLTHVGTTVDPITVEAAPGYWISGEFHELAYMGLDGRLIEDTARVAGNTLVWTAGGVTYRLEGELTRETAIGLAESMR